MPFPEGTINNLTPAQEQKLKEFWTTVLKTFAVIDPNAQQTPPHTATSEAESAKKKGGFFHRKRDSTVEDDDKYGQTKEFQEILGTTKPETLRETFWTMVKDDSPDALLLRFLRARKWDVQKALAMLITTVHWRDKEMKVDEDIMRNGEGGALIDEREGEGVRKSEGRDFLAQLRMGKSFIHGVDKEGRPICVVRVKLHRGGEQSERALERYTVFLIETCRLALTSPVETAVSFSFFIPFPSSLLFSIIYLWLRKNELDSRGNSPGPPGLGARRPQESETRAYLRLWTMLTMNRRLCLT